VSYCALSITTEFGLSSELIFLAAIFLNFRNSSGCDSFQCYYWLCTLTVHFFSRNHLPPRESLLERATSNFTLKHVHLHGNRKEKEARFRGLKHSCQWLGAAGGQCSRTGVRAVGGQLPVSELATRGVNGGGGR
jgi:hypothetical protein